MKDKYIDLIEQSFDFPQDEFSVEDNELNFHDIPLMELINSTVRRSRLPTCPRFPSRSTGPSACST